MRRSYAFLAGFALGAAVALGGCTPTSLVAQPDIVMKSAVPPATLAPCIAQDLGNRMRDNRPKLVYYRGIHEISINSPRGDLLAFLTVEQDWANGSIVSFYNGDLYWPDRTTSGMWPDIARDNWHRAENAVLACQPQSANAPTVKTGATMPPPPAVPVSQVGNGSTLKPLTAKPETAAKPLGPLQLGPTNPAP